MRTKELFHALRARPQRKRTIAFVWDYFGPVHIDRVNAVQARLGTNRNVVGIQFVGESSTYAWAKEGERAFEQFTLFPAGRTGSPRFLQFGIKLLRQCIVLGDGDFFFCHYEKPAVLAVAIILRILGRNVYVMNDSKFDDYPRSLRMEIIKRLFYAPYRGGLTASARSKDYMRFLGIPSNMIYFGYDNISIHRLRAQAPEPFTRSQRDRYFAIVARFVTKKNLAMALDAYARYRKMSDAPRLLYLAGSGPLEGALRAQAAELGIEPFVHFVGFLSSRDVSRLLKKALCLVLPSTEEQFGQVVIEAQAFGLPVLLSENCGSRDLLVRNATNGFVFEPDNPDGLAFFMNILCKDEQLWERMSAAARLQSPQGDVAVFSKAVEELIERVNRPARAKLGARAPQLPWRD